MSSSPTSPNLSAHNSERWLWIVVGLFLVNGAAMGAWGGSMPGLRERVGTDESGIGVLLLITGISALLAMQVSGRLSDKIGPLKPTLAGAGIVAIGLGAVAWAPSYEVLIVAGILLGAGNGIMDIGMNALGVAVERLRPKPVMSRFHGMFSLGSFAGAGVVILTGGTGRTWVPLAIVCLIMAVAAAAIRAAAPHERIGVIEPADDGAGGTRAARIPAVAWLLGLMGLGFGIMEGTATDWSAIHVTDVLGVSVERGAIGLVAVSLSMLATRFVGDWLVEQWGRSRIVQVGAVIAVVGYAGAMVVESMPLVVAAWLLVGVGVGCLAPQVYALAGYIGGGRVLAVVSAFGYFAFLSGPALIGFVAARVGIQGAMAVPMVAAVIVTVLSLAGVLRSAERAGGLAK
ncbi:MAG: MFS transporter [Ruaniaceae bacterium]|nr:MFS transporter [Ruaniaceae bacterium]